MARATPIERLAEHMAGGCPSVIEAARRMKITVAAAEKLWRRVCRDLGPQAR